MFLLLSVGDSNQYKELLNVFKSLVDMDVHQTLIFEVPNNYHHLL